MWSSVVLPEPDGPTIASSSPSSIAEVHVAQRLHGRLARVAAADPAQVDDPLGVCSCGIDRVIGTTTAIPAASPSPDLDEPSSNSPVSTAILTRAVASTDLHGIAALEQRDERVDRDGESTPSWVP